MEKEKGEEKNADQIGTSENVSNNKYHNWLKWKDSHISPNVGILIVVFLIVIIVSSLLYWESLKTGSLNKDEQSSGQYINLTDINLADKEKVDILKSLSSSAPAEISIEEKRKELNQLAEQSEGSPQLREFEKIDILNRLSQ